MARRKGMKAGNHTIKKDTKLDLKAPSYKWLLCRKCNYNEVKVIIEAISCVCSICLCRACPYEPRQFAKPKNPRKKKTTVAKTFEKIQKEETKQDELAIEFKKKKAALKDGTATKPKTKKSKEKPPRKKRVTKRKTAKKKTTKKKKPTRKKKASA